MTFSLSISDFKTVRPTPRKSTPVRVVPEPKTFVLAVEWEETVKEPTVLAVRNTPTANKPTNLVTRILRPTIPLELRMDPTL